MSDTRYDVTAHAVWPTATERTRRSQSPLTDVPLTLAGFWPNQTTESAPAAVYLTPNHSVAEDANADVSLEMAATYVRPALPTSMYGVSDWLNVGIDCEFEPADDAERDRESVMLLGFVLSNRVRMANFHLGSTGKARKSLRFFWNSSWLDGIQTLYPVTSAIHIVDTNIEVAVHARSLART